MAFGTVQADVIGTSVTGSNLGAGNASIMKNRFINGDMRIAQRGTSAVTDGFMVDRWQAYENTAGAFSWQQVADAPAGFIYSSKCTVTTANSSPNSSDVANFQQIIEGFNISDLGFGGSSAKTITVSFWVKSSLTGSFGGSIMNGSVNRSYPFLYTISAANTWEQKSVTITGDTTGSWNTDNSAGMRLMLNIGGGSTVLGTANTWSATRYDGATGSTNILATLNATWQITGVQLEVGSSATGYEYRQYGQELALCQRYYEVFGNGGVASSTTNASNQCVVFKFQVAKRANPTITHLANYSLIWSGNNVFTATSSAINTVSTTGCGLTVSVTPTPGGTGACMVYNTSNDNLSASAEL